LYKKSLYLQTYFIFLLFLSAAPVQAKVITIAGTADLQGKMETTLDSNRSHGGIAHIATLFKALKKENPDTVIVSTGDDLMNRFFHMYKGEAILSLMGDAGYELYAFGNHEFDKGSEVLAKAVGKSSMTPICSDLDVSHSALAGKCLPYLIQNVGGVRVGFFTLMTEDFALVTSERAVTLRGDNVTMAKEMIKTLREKGADLVVLLSHIGYKNDVALAKQVKGIDFIFGGHSHNYVKKMGRIRNTFIVNGGEKGTQAVKADIILDDALHVIDVEMTTIPVNEAYAPDAAITSKLETYLEGFPDAIVLGSTEKPWDLRSKTVRRGESNVINMINDRLRQKFGVDIVVNNAGAFRGSKIYKEGNITDAMLKAIDEFGNYAYTFKLKGRYLKPILERSGANYGDGGLLHCSGLRYEIDLKGDVQKIDNEQVVKKGSRVRKIKVLGQTGWTAPDSEKEYTILSNAFLVTHKGDGFYWFKKYGSDPKNTYTTFYSLIADAIENEKVLTPHDNDGRLRITH